MGEFKKTQSTVTESLLELGTGDVTQRAPLPVFYAERKLGCGMWWGQKSQMTMRVPSIWVQQQRHLHSSTQVQVSDPAKLTFAKPPEGDGSCSGLGKTFPKRGRMQRMQLRREEGCKGKSPPCVSHTFSYSHLAVTNRHLGRDHTC